MHISKESGFHPWLLIVIILTVGIIGVVIWRFLDSSGINLVGQIGGGGTFGSNYNCKDRDVEFTSPPLKMEELGYIRPLGAMLDGHVTPTDHVYVGPVKREVPDNTYPVLMPADGTIVEVGRMPAQYIGDRDVTLAPEVHRVIISFSCRYFAIFIHVHKLVDSLKSQMTGVEAGQNKTMSIDFKAGETIGYIGGDTFDWTPVDVKSTLTGFITPKDYEQEPWKIHTISPFDLYKGDLKTQMEAKSWRTVAPIGGKIDYDQPGKLIGTWFREGTGGYKGNNPDRYWDGHLSVVPDYIDPTYSIVSIGNWQDKAVQFVVDGMPNLASISVSSGMVKMQLRVISYTSDDPSWQGSGPAVNIHPDFVNPVVGTIAFQVLDGEKLKVEKFVGKTADQVTGFTSAVQTYER